MLTVFDIIPITRYAIFLFFVLYFVVLICFSTTVLYLFDCCWLQVWNKPHYIIVIVMFSDSKISS